jgi:hypothetical protein
MVYKTMLRDLNLELKFQKGDDRAGRLVKIEPDSWQSSQTFGESQAGRLVKLG